MTRPVINLSTVSDSANSYWKARNPRPIQARRGECCQCRNDAVYYDSEGTGYCLRHWHGGELQPGMDCAELMYRDKTAYWVTGTQIVPGKSERYGCVWTFRKTTHKPVLMDIKRLLPIRRGMPKVELKRFCDVFDCADYSKQGQVLEVDSQAVQEDKSDAQDFDF